MRPLHSLFVATVICALAFSGCNCGSDPDVNADGGNAGGAGGGTAGGGEGGGEGGGSGGGDPDSGVLPPDPTDPNNSLKDSDCDGLTDQEEFSTTYAGNKKTDPANP